MSLVLTASGRLNSVTNFFASSRTSMTLLRRANTGASGKEATKRVTKPNWMTRREHTGEAQQGAAGMEAISSLWSPVLKAAIGFPFLPACTSRLPSHFCSQSQGHHHSESKLSIRPSRQNEEMCDTGHLPPTTLHHYKLIIGG